MREIEIIDSELRLVAALRHAARERGGSAAVDRAGRNSSGGECLASHRTKQSSCVAAPLDRLM
jgi:hypothetical protein